MQSYGAPLANNASSISAFVMMCTPAWTHIMRQSAASTSCTRQQAHAPDCFWCMLVLEVHEVPQLVRVPLALGR